MPNVDNGCAGISVATSSKASDRKVDRAATPCSPFQVQAIRRNLLRWYDRHRRDLPWRRRAGDPYAQWVAEIMLQQTRVDTVIPYYERFLNSFPSAKALAAADEEVVLKHWEGLGYYRRIQHLHRAAKVLAQDGRDVPRSSMELRELPGIGAYTSAAISSIAGGEPVAAVDGNVARVVARLFALRADVLSFSGRKQVQAVADALLARKRPGDFNQAWMDLGSSICTPRSPDCACCPLSTHCAAHAQGLTDELPRRGTDRKRHVPVLRQVTVYVRDDAGRVLVRRRPPGGLWSGLWEYPSRDIEGNEKPNESAIALLKSLKLAARECDPIGRIEHQLTHRLMCFDVFNVSTSRRAVKTPSPSMQRWVNSDELTQLAMATAQRKIQRLVAAISD